MNLIRQGLGALGGGPAAPLNVSPPLADDDLLTASKETLVFLIERLRSPDPSNTVESKRELTEEISNLCGINREIFVDDTLKSMVNLLTKEGRDLEITRNVLDILSSITDAETSLESRATATAESSRILGMLVHGDVSVFLDLLELTDYKVRFGAASLLRRLLQHDISETQKSILRSRTGVSLLVETLRDQREIIRNEGLLLLDEISRENEEIQKILCFESAFERLLEIIRSEGGAEEGGVIVRDAFRCMQTLLSSNTSNIRYFRETGCLHSLSSLLLASSITDISRASDKKASALSSALSVLQCLVSSKLNPSTPNTLLLDQFTKSKTSIQSSPLTGLILQWSLSPLVPESVSIESLHFLSDLVHKHRPTQDKLENFSLIDSAAGTTEIGSMRLCKMALTDPSPRKRTAALQCFFKLLDENADLQLFIASTVKPRLPTSPKSEEGLLLGRYLAESLLQLSPISESSSIACLRSSQIFSLLVSQTESCRALLLELPWEVDKQGAVVQTFYSAVVSAALSSLRSKSSDVLVQSGLLRLLCAWLYQCPQAAAAHAFIHASATNTLFLVELLTSGDENVHTLGLSAVLLSLLTLEHTSPSALADLILNRISLDKFNASWDRFRRSGAFAKAHSSIASSSSSTASPFNLLSLLASFGSDEQQESLNIYDPAFTRFCLSIYDRLQQRLISIYSADTERISRLVFLPPTPSTPPPSAAVAAEDLTAPSDAVLAGPRDDMMETINFAAQKQSIDSSAAAAQAPKEDSMASSAVIQQYKELIRQQDKDLEQLKEELRTASETISTLSFERDDKQREAQEMKSHSESLQLKVDALTNECQQLKTECERLNQELVGQQETNKDLEKEFRAFRSIAEDNIASLKVVADNYERELRSVSELYSSLEAEARRKDEELGLVRPQLEQVSKDRMELEQREAAAQKDKEEAQKYLNQKEAELATALSKLEVTRGALQSREQELSDREKELAEREAAGGEVEALKLELEKSRQAEERQRLLLNETERLMLQREESYKSKLEDAELKLKELKLAQDERDAFKAESATLRDANQRQEQQIMSLHELMTSEREASDKKVKALEKRNFDLNQDLQAFLSLNQELGE